MMKEALIAGFVLAILAIITGGIIAISVSYQRTQRDAAVACIQSGATYIRGTGDCLYARAK
jgi:hypothetical protein